MKRHYKVIVETSEKDRPYDFEMSAAILVAEYFKTDVVFLRPTPLKSPDLKINGQIWELKSPMGDGRDIESLISQRYYSIITSNKILKILQCIQ